MVSCCFEKLFGAFKPMNCWEPLWGLCPYLLKNVGYLGNKCSFITKFLFSKRYFWVKGETGSPTGQKLYVTAINKSPIFFFSFLNTEKNLEELKTVLVEGEKERSGRGREENRRRSRTRVKMCNASSCQRSAFSLMLCFPSCSSSLARVKNDVSRSNCIS